MKFIKTTILILIVYLPIANSNELYSKIFKDIENQNDLDNLIQLKKNACEKETSEIEQIACNLLLTYKYQLSNQYAKAKLSLDSTYILLEKFTIKQKIDGIDKYEAEVEKYINEGDNSKQINLEKVKLASAKGNKEFNDCLSKEGVIDQALESLGKVISQSDDLQKNIIDLINSSKSEDELMARLDPKPKDELKESRQNLKDYTNEEMGELERNNKAKANNCATPLTEIMEGSQPVVSDAVLISYTKMSKKERNKSFNLLRKEAKDSSTLNFKSKDYERFLPQDMSSMSGFMLPPGLNIPGVTAEFIALFKPYVALNVAIWTFESGDADGAIPITYNAIQAYSEYYFQNSQVSQDLIKLIAISQQLAPMKQFQRMAFGSSNNNLSLQLAQFIPLNAEEKLLKNTVEFFITLENDDTANARNIMKEVINKTSSHLIAKNFELEAKLYLAMRPSMEQTNEDDITKLYSKQEYITASEDYESALAIVFSNSEVEAKLSKHAKVNAAAFYLAFNKNSQNSQFNIDPIFVELKNKKKKNNSKYQERLSELLMGFMTSRPLSYAL